MHMFFAYEKIDTGNRQNDHKQKDCRRRSIGREATAVPVKHVVNIADNRIHPSRVQIRSKQRNCVAVGFKRADKPGNNQIKIIGEIIGTVIFQKILVFEVPSTFAAL